MTATQPPTADQIIAALREHNGDIQPAAEALGISDYILGRRIRQDPALVAARAEIKQQQAQVQQERVRRFAQAILEAKGVINQAARALGCSTDTVSRYIDRYPEVEAALAQAKTLYPSLAQIHERFEPAAVIEALLAANGIRKQAARALGCSRRAVDRYCNTYPEVAAACAEGRATLLDNAESALSNAVDREAPWAVQFALRTLGRDRGYTERTETAILQAADPALRAELEETIRRIYGDAEDGEAAQDAVGSQDGGDED